MPRYPYILTRNGSHYFRLAVPSHLMEAIGKTELVYSLRTKDIAVALPRSIHLLNVAQQEFHRCLAGEKGAVLALIRGAVRQFDPSKPMIVTPDLISAWKGEAKVEPENPSIFFSTAFDEYLAECKGERKNGLGKKQAICNLWIEAMSDKSVKSISKKQARDFKALLMKLPVNMKQRYMP